MSRDHHVLLLAQIHEVKTMTFFYDIKKKLDLLVESTHVEESCNTEQLDELGKGTLGSYIKKAAGDVDDTGYAQAHDIHRLKAQPSHAQYVRDRHQSRLDKRHKGIERATDRLTKEDQLDELSKDTLDSYHDKSKKARDSIVTNHEYVSDKGKRDLGKRQGGIEAAKRALDRKDELSNESSMTESTATKYIKSRLRDMAIDCNERGDLSGENSINNVINLLSKKGVSAAYNFAEKIDSYIGKPILYIIQSEMERNEINELSKDTLGNYVKKASRDAGEWHAMKDELRDRLPSQSAYSRKKMDKRHQGIDRAVDRLTKEDQLDELSKDTLSNYSKAASRKKDDATTIYKYVMNYPSNDVYNDVAELNHYGNKIQKRTKGIERATDGLTREGFGEETGISAGDLADILCNRILVRKPELLKDFGPSEVTQACESVAEFHAGAEELGSSDISIMIREVERELRDYAEYKQQKLDEISDELSNRVANARHDAVKSADRGNRDEMMSTYNKFSKNQKLGHRRDIRQQKAGIKGRDPRSAQYQDAKHGQYFGDSMENDDQPINELSPSTLGSYIKKAAHEVGYAGGAERAAGERRDRATEREYGRHREKRERGISKAIDKMVGHPVDESQLDELSPKTLGKYVRGASGDAIRKSGHLHYDAGQAAGRGDDHELTGWKRDSTRKVANRQQGIGRAVDRLALGYPGKHDDWTKPNYDGRLEEDNQQWEAVRVYFDKYTDRELGEKVIAGPFDSKEEARESASNDDYRSYGNKTRTYFRPVKDEKLDELSPSTLGSYIKKASHERGYHGTEAGRSGANRYRSLERSHTYKGEKRQRGIDTAVNKIVGGPVDEGCSNQRNNKLR